MVSQWNAYEFDENGHVNSDPNKIYSKDQQMELVDGNSVNYSEGSESRERHSEYDSVPVKKYDPEVRKRIGKGWSSPSDNPREIHYYDKKSAEKEADLKIKER